MDPTYGRVSYTQLEFLYASHQGRKTWVIVIGEGCHRDKPLDQLDLPQEAAYLVPTGYQAERQKLQQDYIGQLKRENYILKTANNDTELQKIDRGLRVELGELELRPQRAEIFISYAREDQEQAAAVAEALISFGWKVFWDRSIALGKAWDKVIEEAI